MQTLLIRDSQTAVLQTLAQKGFDLADPGGHAAWFLASTLKICVHLGLGPE